jgi:tetratricopeptide (TPR) repeat protein
MSQLQDGKTFNLHPAKSRSNPYRILVLAFLIMGGIWLLLRVNRGQVQSPFNPTATPTRSPQSYIMAAQAYFAAGKLDDPASDQDAIGAYQQALRVDPNNAEVWAEMARIQTYSSSTLSTDQERLDRLQEALDSAEKAAELAPDDSTVNAINAFVLDWNASSNLITPDQREAYLARAETAANRAYLLDPQNALALAFYAEVLLDQQKWDQAKQYATQAVELAPDSMDAHRVLGLVFETWAYYRDAIDEYIKASDITPNLTFLYLRIGLVYRQLALATGDAKSPIYIDALDYFEKAANINAQLGIKDPYPYIAIAKTYAQQGEFFIASRNAEKALSFDPANSDTYGQLGMVYVQARNYETALPALRCAVDGCTADQNDTIKVFQEQGILPKDLKVDVAPLPLTNLNIAYYYVRYGSVLAYLSTADNGYCSHSLELMTQLRLTYPDDPVLMQNVEDNEATCQSLWGSPSSTAAPTALPSPEATATSTPIIFSTPTP